MTEIVINYEPREQQLKIHDAIEQHRFTVVVAHRRMGKTVSAINHLIKAAIECDKPNPRFAYIAPTYSQAKRVAWDYLLEYTRPLGATANIAELRVDFWGRRISLYGSDNADSLRGQYFDGVVLDEIGDQNPKIWNEIVRPALADRLGWASFIGTPKGNNHFRDLADRAKETDGWAYLEFKASETSILPESELKAAQLEMGEDKYNQEFECSFNAAVEGSYYGKLINDLEKLGRISDFPRDDLCRSFAAWDLGMGDSTTIWIAQLAGKEVRLLDCIENHGQGLDWYVNWLRDNKYEQFNQILPHDVQVRELGTGKSRKEVLEEAGLSITVCPRLSVADGIQAVRRLIPRCWFHPKTKNGLNALRNYRREHDEKRNIFYEKPLHDWCFTGDTKILTRSGTHRIMDLPFTGEVLTSCGWKQYIHPRITRKNAQLVEVTFKDGYSVRCTPDHLFKTVNGWKSAESLTKGLRIQSTLTRLHSISMADFIGNGLATFTSRVVGKSYIGTYGGKLLEKSLKAVTSTIKTAIQQIMPLKTWNAWQLQTTGSRLMLIGETGDTKALSMTLLEKKPQTGISRKKAGYGTKDTPKNQSRGQSGSALLKIALFVTSSLKGLSAKAATARYIAPLIAKPLIIESVRPLDYLEDVWCLTVDDVAEFSLVNGAVVHNCSHYADAFRYLAIGLDESDSSWSTTLPIKTNWIV